MVQMVPGNIILGHTRATIYEEKNVRTSVEPERGRWSLIDNPERARRWS